MTIGIWKPRPIHSSNRVMKPMYSSPVHSVAKTSVMKLAKK